MYFDARDNTEFDQRGYFLANNSLGTAPNPNNFVLLHNINISLGGVRPGELRADREADATGGVRVTNDTKSTDLLLHPNFATWRCR